MYRTPVPQWPHANDDEQCLYKAITITGAQQLSTARRRDGNQPIIIITIIGHTVSVVTRTADRVSRRHGPTEAATVTRSVAAATRFDDAVPRSRPNDSRRWSDRAVRRRGGPIARAVPSAAASTVVRLVDGGGGGGGGVGGRGRRGGSTFSRSAPTTQTTRTTSRRRRSVTLVRPSVGVDTGL